MSTTIAHNMSAINTQRQFGVSARGMAGSMEKLSSGYKINTGKDSPSGLLISEQLRSQLAGIQRATQNSEEAMNVMGIAEGALAELNNILKTMKTLATHSANSGVTSAEQVAADQTELDSAIQTMDRIAQTTQFSNDNILNGAKELDFTVTTNVKGTQQNSLVNERESAFNQIFKRSGYSVSVNFVGGKGSIVSGAADYSLDGASHAGTALTGDGRYVDFGQQATKAYLEIDTATPNASLPGGGFPAAQVKNGVFTQEQIFTLTGSGGSRQFTFAKNASVSQLVRDIHSTVGATGIDASLIFNSAQSIDQLTQDVGAGGLDANGDHIDGTYANGNVARTAGQAAVFNSIRLESEEATDKGLNSGDVAAGCVGVSDLVGIQWGRNTDGQGNIYIKYVSDTEVEYYKDSSMTKESLVAVGMVKYDDGTPGYGTASITAVNNSGLGGSIRVANFGIPDYHLPDVASNYISTGGLEGGNRSGAIEDPANPDWNQEGAVTWSGNTAQVAGVYTARTNNTANFGGNGALFDASASVITGVELGTNTSDDGSIYFKTVCENGTIQVFAYKDKDLTQASLVAQSAVCALPISTIVLDEVRDRNNTNGTGLGIVLSVGDSANATPIPDTATGTTTGSASFNNLGARIYASEYGSEHFVKVTQDSGAIFTSYDSPGNSTRTLIDAGDKGTTKVIYGQDATISVNGQEVKTNGLELKVATQDLQAELTFNAGKVGSTTLAQVGYGTGSLFTKLGMLNQGDNRMQPEKIKVVNPDYDENAAPGHPDARRYVEIDNPDWGLSGYLCNAGHNTSETIGDFQGGMQLQLGEGEEDQNRTVVSIKSMTAENIGRVTVGGYWDSSNPSVWSERTFCLKDCLGGGMACLSDDPTLTMKIVDQTIKDVSYQRALIGAMQSNLLQTNINNLEVTFENVTATEAGIRDTDMAEEMTEYTKNQVLQSAAMSMMAQANQSSQNVLQLLQ